MIKKEFYKKRADGVELYKTYSDIDHKIRNKRTGTTYSEAIDVSEDEEYEEIEEYIEIDGVETYEDVVDCLNASLESMKNVSRKINRLGLTNNEALSVKEVYPTWKSKINCTIEQGYIVLHDDDLWKARQTHTALEAYPPSIYTASLYEVVEYEHVGTMEDPIPYTPPMEVFEGKYYTQFDVLYLCTRDSGTALTHDLFDLRGIYVELL